MDQTYICSLDENDLKYCVEVLNEDEEKRELYISEIREWIKKNQHLNAYEDSFDILRFLRSSKFDIEKTKTKIKNFYTFKSSAPEWFKNRDPLLPELQTLLKIGVFLPLLKRDSHGRLVILIRTAVHDPSLQKQNDVFKIGMMALDLALKAEDTSVYGLTAIFDMKGITLGHAKALSVGIIKKAVASWQIHVHGSNIKLLHAIVPKEILPEEYGGTDGKLQELIDHWHRKVTDSRQWLKETEKHIANIDT